jgi:hypothetical protein
VRWLVVVVPSEEVMLLLLEKLKEVELVKLELEDMVVVGVLGGLLVVWWFGSGGISWLLSCVCGL